MDGIVNGGAYYNEHDPFAAAWLRNLIKAGLIVSGDVDDRDIRDVRPSDLAGYIQCHFFAGIGGWSYALRLAGIPDGARVWTGSCPCQPFSAAGRGLGFADKRHLWPAFFHLIEKRRPDVVFGEQVASKDGLAWLDLVCADLEGTDYAVGTLDTCAAGFGAPHIRQRLFWGARRVADTHGRDESNRDLQRIREHGFEPPNGSSVCLADAMSTRRPEWRPGRSGSSGLADSRSAGLEKLSEQPTRTECATAERSGAAGELADATDKRHEWSGVTRRRRDGSENIGTISELGNAARNEQRQHRIANEILRQESEAGRSSPWRDLEWLSCRDGKVRPTQPGLFPLAHGVPGRVGLLRGYGNAIVPQVAAEFIQAYFEAEVANA